LQEKSQEQSRSYANARSRVAALQQAGTLSEREILAFARQGEFEEVVIALSELCGLPTAQTERLIFERLAIVFSSSQELLRCRGRVSANC
jgi:hypothetical protein